MFNIMTMNDVMKRWKYNIFILFSQHKNIIIHAPSVLPPGGINWQLIFPHQSTAFITLWSTVEGATGKG
jgi:hypothetical protein